MKTLSLYAEMRSGIPYEGLPEFKVVANKPYYITTSDNIQAY